MKPDLRLAAEQAKPASAVAGPAPATGLAPPRRTRQSGGTFLGLLLGVLFGLAAALAVAIYVAKVPVPLVSKNTTRTNGQDAAEAEKNKDWDPNAALRGKNGARSGAAASGSVAPAPAPAPIPAPTEVARPAPDSKPAESRAADKAAEPVPPAVTARPAPARPSSDPLGDLAAARAGATPAAPAAAADPFAYFVQAGAFRTPEDADAQRARLSLMGVEARVSEREQAGRTVYRVRVGPFQNKDAADRVKQRLDGDGFDAALVRVQK
jgi:cell division protein FtsN